MITQNAFSLPTLQMKFKVEKDGVVLHEHKELGHSWLRNAWNIFTCMMMDIPAVSQDKTVGEGRLTYRNNAGIVQYSATLLPRRGSNTLLGSGFFNTSDNDNTFGIVIGTSNTSFHPDDYKLYGLIASGTGSGQLYYIGQTGPVTEYNSGTKKWTNTLLRFYNNNSSGSITVKEAGLQWGNGTTDALLTRDVLDTPVEVDVGAQLTVTYVIESISFADLEEATPDLPALGTYGCGGVFVGLASTHTPANPELLICSKSGGDAGSKKWQDPEGTIPGTTDANDGRNNMSALYALGALSGIGTFCSDENTAALNGFDDWYIPSRYELSQLYTNRAYLTGGDAFAASVYWSSTSSAEFAYYANFSTGSQSNANQSNSNRVRLIRCVSIYDWVAD